MVMKIVEIVEKYLKFEIGHENPRKMIYAVFKNFQRVDNNMCTKFEYSTFCKICLSWKPFAHYLKI